MQNEGWNVFQHKVARALWCAVPAERAVPRFLMLGAWTHAPRDPEPARPAFRTTVASHSVGLNGFYLFHHFGRGDGHDGGDFGAIGA